MLGSIDLQLDPPFAGYAANRFSRWCLDPSLDLILNTPGYLCNQSIMGDSSTQSRQSIRQSQINLEAWTSSVLIHKTCSRNIPIALHFACYKSVLQLTGALVLRKRTLRPACPAPVYGSIFSSSLNPRLCDRTCFSSKELIGLSSGTRLQHRFYSLAKTVLINARLEDARYLDLLAHHMTSLEPSGQR